VNRGEKMMLYPGHTPTMPKSYLTLEDHSTWYYKKAVAVGALMWYNLTAEATTHWRNRWFRHLLGNESEVLIRRSKFPKEDALVSSPTRRSLSLVIQMISYRHIQLCHGLHYGVTTLVIDV
jgi:hypothetical protein